MTEGKRYVKWDTDICRLLPGNHTYVSCSHHFYWPNRGPWPAQLQVWWGGRTFMCTWKEQNFYVLNCPRFQLNLSHIVEAISWYLLGQGFAQALSSKFFSLKFYSFFFPLFAFSPTQIFIKSQLEVRHYMTRSEEWGIQSHDLNDLEVLIQWRNLWNIVFVYACVYVHMLMCTENLVRGMGNKGIILKMTFRSSPNWSWVHIKRPGMSTGQLCDSKNYLAVTKLLSLERLNHWHIHDWSIHCYLWWDIWGLKILSAF